MKKMFHLISILCIAAMLLMACGKKQDTTGSDTGADTQGDTTAETSSGEAGAEAALRFSWWGADTRHKPYLATFDLYKQSHPNITVAGEYQAWDGFQEKLITELSGGTEPDIMTLDAPWVNELATRSDYFVDLYSQDILDYSGIDEQFMKDYGEVNGKLVAIPLGQQCTSLIINKTAADKYGIDVSEDKVFSYDDLMTIGTQLHSENPDAYLLNSDSGSVFIMATSMLKQLSGNQIFTDDYQIGFSKENLLEVYTWIANAYQAGVMEPLGDAELFFGTRETNPKWVNGELVATLDWNGTTIRYISTLQEGSEIICRTYPTVGDAAKDGSVIMRPIFMGAVSNNSQNKDAALEFLNWFINSDEAAVSLGSSKGVAATESQIKVQDSQGVVDASVVEGLNYGLKGSPSQKENALTTNTELSSLFTDEVAKLAYGEVSPEDGVEETFSMLEGKLGQLKSAK